MPKIISGSLPAVFYYEFQTDLILPEIQNLSTDDINISPQLPFGGSPTVADLNDNNAHKQQSDYRERVTRQFVQELTDDIPIILGVICGAIGITIYLNSRGFFGSFVGMSLLVVGVLFPWRMLVLLVI